MAESEEPKSIVVTIRLFSTGAESSEKNIKVLERVRVSHLLKTISWSFNRSGFYNQDFDAFLIKPDIEINMELTYKLKDYGIQNQDVIEVRRKNLPISLQVNIHDHDAREYQVNASLPVYEIVKQIGKILGVENTRELSLALPQSNEKSRASIVHMSWLDPTKSLNSQGIKSGDTLLLRKKFFVFNEDITEAEKNPLLKELLYYQLKKQITQAELHSRTVSVGFSSTSSDQDSLNDDGMEMLSDVMKSFETTNDSNGDSTNGDIITPIDQLEWLQTVSKHQTHMSKFFPIQSTEETKARYLCLKSNEVYLTASAHFSTEISFIKKWSIEEITWERFENGLKQTTGDNSHVLFTSEPDQIREYLDHMTCKVKSTEPSAPETGTNTDETPEQKKLSPTPTLSIPSSIEEDSGSEQEEAGIGVTLSTSSGAEAMVPYDRYSPPPVFSPPHVKKEKTSNITPPAYFGLGYKDLIDTHVLVNVIILDEEIRQLLVNVTQPVRLVIRDICATYNIQYPEDHYLKYPKAVEDIFAKYGGIPKLQTGGQYRSLEKSKPRNVLDEETSLINQLNLEMKPLVLLLKRRNFDEADAVERYHLDIGEEWPEGEDSGVARYRKFYQNWVGIVQGERTITKETAIRLAGLLTFIYHGSSKNAPFWPPPEFDSRYFLPEKFHGVNRIENAVLKAHRQYENTDLNQAIDSVIQICADIPSAGGVQFDVKVPVKTEILNIVPWKKMESQVLCIDKEGFSCLRKGGKKICLQQDYSNIKCWANSDTCFRLEFGEENPDFNGYTYQAKQIMEMLHLYVKMAYKESQLNPKKKDTVSESDV